jgi:hypothetical protein
MPTEKSLGGGSDTASSGVALRIDWHDHCRAVRRRSGSMFVGIATILMFVFIEMSVMTDDVIEGKTSELHFRRAVASPLWIQSCLPR